MYFANQEYQYFPLINDGATIYIYMYGKKVTSINSQEQWANLNYLYTERNETSFNTLFLKLKKSLNRYVSELLLTLKPEEEEKDSAKRLPSLQNQKKEN